jgi:hypothetical protein
VGLWVRLLLFTVFGGIVGEVVGVYSVWWDCGIGCWCLQCLARLNNRFKTCLCHNILHFFLVACKGPRH